MHIESGPKRQGTDCGKGGASAAGRWASQTARSGRGGVSTAPSWRPCTARRSSMRPGAPPRTSRWAHAPHPVSRSRWSSDSAARPGALPPFRPAPTTPPRHRDRPTGSLWAPNWWTVTTRDGDCTPRTPSPTSAYTRDWWSGPPCPWRTTKRGARTRPTRCDESRSRSPGTANGWRRAPARRFSEVR